jgi:4-oxalmesaconate hydratase
MIIDCHGHYTTTPPGVGVWRDAQKGGCCRRSGTCSRAKGVMAVSDAEIRESIEANQLRVQRERGTDVTIFSPRGKLDGPSYRQRLDLAGLDRTLQ